VPIFEFECPRCNHRFDDLLRSSSAKNPPCPKCKCVKTQRLMSTFSMGGCASEGGHSHGGGSCSCGGCSSGSCSGCKH
jgi:putative FmdB family regulatory protein